MARDRNVAIANSDLALYAILSSDIVLYVDSGTLSKYPSSKWMHTNTGVRMMPVMIVYSCVLATFFLFLRHMSCSANFHQASGLHQRSSCTGINRKARI